MIVKDLENAAVTRVGRLFKLVWSIVCARKEVPESNELRLICHNCGVSYYDVVELFNQIKQGGDYGE